MSWDFLFGRFLTLLLLGHIGLILWNLRVVVRPKVGAPTRTPTVSLLVPARNEEADIRDCLAALLAQEYEALEILVLDDRSTDSTAQIVRSFEADHITLMEGEELPSGWTGKNWACHQLYTRASGDILCFVDADTILEPGAVSAAVETILKEEVDLVAVLPRSEARGAAEATVLPMFNNAVLGLFPTSRIERSPNPELAIAFGPFLPVTRSAYEASGGHAAKPGHVVDDIQLARSVKASGGQVKLVNGTDLVSTRWYKGLGEVWKGFSKNAYGGIGYRPALAAAIVLVLVPLLLTPFVRLGAGALSNSIPAVVVLQVAVLLTGRLITGFVGRDPTWSVPLYPFAVGFWAATLVWSVVLSATGKTVEWKGRRVGVGGRRTRSQQD